MVNKVFWWKYVRIKKKELKRNSKFNTCAIVTEDEDFNNFYFYSTSLVCVDHSVTYDWGNGEKSYKKKEFTPKKKLYKKFKDLLDCHNKSSKENCHKTSSKF